MKIVMDEVAMLETLVTKELVETACLRHRMLVTDQLFEWKHL